MSLLADYLKQSAQKKGFIFVPYLALGDPDWEASLDIIQVLFELGADSIELGLPFTDPTADGFILQKSFSRVLKEDFKMSKLFAFLEKSRERFPDKSFLLMGYANIFYQYGYSKLLKDLKKFHVSGLVIPDLPFEEKSRYQFPQKTDTAFIDFITPTTSPEKIQKICADAQGFLYLVSTKGVTGKSSFDTSALKLAREAKKLTQTPVLVGFGIRNKTHIKKVLEYADGFIIGSLIHQIIEDNYNNKKNMLHNIRSTLGKILPKSSS